MGLKEADITIFISGPKASLHPLVKVTILAILTPLSQLERADIEN